MEGAALSYLDIYLEPLALYLGQPDVTDLYVNRPGEVWIERLGGAIEREERPELTEALLWRLARQVAALSHQGISREHPLLSARLPHGARIQVVAPPATHGSLAVAIRKHVSAPLRLVDYEESDHFAATRVDGDERANTDGLRRLVESRQFTAALVQAVNSRKNIVVSGGTSSGKTTFLNALMREIPIEERIITIEDTPELRVEHPNSVALVSVRSELGETRVNMNDLVSAALRMRPDRIILGEIRGFEALAFLRAVNTGHPGSITTIHADSPEGAVEQLVMLSLESRTNLSRADIRHLVTSSVDVFVHLTRRRGRRIVEFISLTANFRI